MSTDSAPSSVRSLLEAYRRVVLTHPLLDRALSQVERGIAPGMPPQIVLLLGPTGVGKTTLVQALDRCTGPPASRLVRMTCVPVAGRRGYDFGRMHWRLIAQAADDPFSDDHFSPDAAASRLRSGHTRRDGPATTDEFHLGVLAMLRARGARAVVLDEAQHMTRVPSARSQADQLDVIKDCVDRTGIPHVLVGTYELSVMVAPGDQLGRRSLVVHFPPYRPSESSDRQAFQRIFGQLVSELPLPAPHLSWEELRGHLFDVYVGCAGCIGILKDWLCGALQFVLETGEEVVDWNVMDECRLSNEALFAVAQQIRAYRESSIPALADVERALAAVPGAQAGGRKRRSSVSPKPGNRVPVRDPVGLPKSAASG